MNMKDIKQMTDVTTVSVVKTTQIDIRKSIRMDTLRSDCFIKTVTN